MERSKLKDEQKKQSVRIICVKAVNRTNCAELRVLERKAVVKLSCPKIANGVDWRGGHPSRLFLEAKRENKLGRGKSVRAGGRRVCRDPCDFVEKYINDCCRQCKKIAEIKNRHFRESMVEGGVISVLNKSRVTFLAAIPGTCGKGGKG